MMELLGESGCYITYYNEIARVPEDHVITIGYFDYLDHYKNNLK